jgi:hypothetical protein
MSAPEVAACRDLTQGALKRPSDDSPVVECSQRHTAESFYVGEFPDELDGEDPDRPELGVFVHDVCQTKFLDFLGADESLGLRTLLTWVWFRPAANAWDQGARWFRCDVVGGGEQSKSLVALPTTAQDILAGPPDDAWMTCASGPTVDGSVKLPCSSQHNWRAVSTVVLGNAITDYPGDKDIQARTSDFCEDSVSAWLGYPEEFEFAYTWFGEAEWEAGNRRSVCWAKTNR